MAYRGSLTACIEQMAHQFSLGNYELLSIICNPTAKYYTLMTDEELTTEPLQPTNEDRRLVCRLTKTELRKFLTNRQNDLFRKQPHADN